MWVRISTADGGKAVANRARVADTFWGRLRGLMLAPPLPPGEGLLLEPCTSVHMLFMRFPIDVVFLAADLRVVACYHSLRPWVGLSGWHRDAAKALELPAGTLIAAGIVPGMQFTLERL
ncbi:MAG: DUF192 domain-containing protein [Candidatus Riflebacteria bacterium]|nr:DUF192 domain-containing protein [Candidatus Riflebacteria bacterium]